MFGFIARFAGDLLNTATGWAGTLMFGRVPQSHRRYLTAMLGGSVLWVVLVIVFLVPGILSWSLSTTPHPSFITSSWLAARRHARGRPRAARRRCGRLDGARLTKIALRASGVRSSRSAATCSPR